MSGVRVGTYNPGPAAILSDLSGSRPGDGSSSILGLILKAFRAYSDFLKFRPLLTKSVTSAVIAALGNLASQILLKPSPPTTTTTESSEDASSAGSKKSPPVKLRPILAFSAYGLLLIGPLTHLFYGSLERCVPWDHGAPFGTMLKRILVERLLFTPLLCAATVGSLELLMAPLGSADVPRALRSRTWPTLLAHWKIWTLPQIINVNFVPVQFRVLFANFVAFFWNIYLALLTQRSKKEE